MPWVTRDLRSEIRRNYNRFAGFAELAQNRLSHHLGTFHVTDQNTMLRQGGNKKELQALAHPEIAIPGSYGPMSSWLSGNVIFDVHFKRISGDVKSFVDKGRIDAKARARIATALGRASKYYKEGVGLFQYAVTLEGLQYAQSVGLANTESFKSHAQKLIIVSLANLRCAQEVAWSAELKHRSLRRRKRRFKPIELDLEGAAEKKGSGTTGKKKSGGGLLLVGVAAVGLLVFSKR